MSPLTSERPTRARGAAGYVGGFFAVGLGLSALYATTGAGVLCPFRTLTGWDCPLCGGTRMGSALLHGDVAAAWSFNPVALALVAALGLLGVVWAMEAAGGPALRLPRPVGQRLRTIPPTGWLVGGLVLFVLDTVLRNLF